MAKGLWQLNLYNAMNDPTLIVYRDELVVIIKDKYPKSEYHFLILPQGKIENLTVLAHGHINLIKHMGMVADRFISKYPGNSFWLGFHAIPSMVQLHMHLISDDFRGFGLKTQKHWNSFTTSFFIPSSKVLDDLARYGKVILPSELEGKALLQAPLICHKCNHRPVNMPSLKLHLLTHMKI